VNDEMNLGLPKFLENLSIHMVGFLLLSTTLHMVLSKRPTSVCSGHLTTDLIENRIGGNSSGLGLRPMAGSCEHNNEPLDSIKC
jgi:hypothetical protein